MSFKSAAALWSQDRWKPIVAGAVNLGTNILFVVLLPDAYKLDGVIFSTIIGFAFIQIPWESHVMFSYFFSRSESRLWWRSQLRFALFAVSLCAVAWCVAHLVPLAGIAGLATKGVAALVVSAGAVLAIFHEDISAIVRSKRGR